MLNDETRAERHGRKIQYARHLRKHMTAAEKVLWSALRKHRLQNLKFRRQAPLGEYVVDFLCFEKRLVIEVDGSVHEMQKRYDQERERALVRAGYITLRFCNEDVLQDLPSVLRVIFQYCHPSPGGRPGGGRGDGGVV